MKGGGGEREGDGGRRLGIIVAHKENHTPYE